MRIHAIAFDCAAPQTLGAWWSDALGFTIGGDHGSTVLLPPTFGTPVFLFQKKTAKVQLRPNCLHVDFSTPYLDRETERLVATGATVVEIFNLPQIRYTTLTDPDGNKFNLIEDLIPT